MNAFYSVRVCISRYVLYLDYDSRMIINSIGQLIAVVNIYLVGFGLRIETGAERTTIIMM